MKAIKFTVLLLGLLLGACEKGWQEEMPPSETQGTFTVALNPQSRAPQDLDLDVYTAKVYMFKETDTATETFSYWKEADLTGNVFQTEGLTVGVRHRFVFMALPKGQTPELPSHTGNKPDYTDADLAYITGNQTRHEVFRNILTFTPEKTTADNRYSIVLTRQNGALQVRMSNTDGLLAKVKLEVDGMSGMYLHDGTGGKVITKGTAIRLSEEETPEAVKDYRITVNLLPAEDVTNKGKLTLTYTDGSTKEYPLTSTQGGIPIFPNQITWLTLNGAGDGDGNFDVNFGPDIDLDDDEWDGIHKVIDNNQ